MMWEEGGGRPPHHAEGSLRKGDPEGHSLLTVLASVARLTGCAAVAPGPQALTRPGEPARDKVTAISSAPACPSPCPCRALPTADTHWFSGSSNGQAHGWQSSGVPAVASP